MKKLIKNCEECPFFNSEYDSDEKISYNECGLAIFLNYSNYSLPEQSTPDWCPLKKEEYTFEFENQSQEPIDKIEEFKEKLEELKLKVSELTSNSSKLNELYNNLNNLYKK